MVEWHGIIWLKNAIPRHSFLLWLAIQQKLTTQDLVFKVPTGAHSISLTMKITTTCSLNALILKWYGGMFVTYATFLEWGKAGMNGLDGLLSLGMVKLMCIMGIIIHLVRLKLMCKRIQMVQWQERERNNYKGPW
jgi:hypothetical protein